MPFPLISLSCRPSFRQRKSQQQLYGKLRRQLPLPPAWKPLQVHTPVHFMC